MAQPHEVSFRSPTVNELGLVSSETRYFHPPADKQVAIAAALLCNMGFLSSPKIETAQTSV